MLPFITDVPNQDFQAFRTITLEYQYDVPVREITTGLSYKPYFLVTDMGEMINYPKYITYNELFKTELLSHKSISAMHVSTMLFKGTKPLGGKELEVLNKTYKRLLSKTPTKL